MDLIEPMQKHSCYHRQVHTHTAVEAHAQTFMRQRLDTHTVIKPYHTYEPMRVHALAFQTAPQGHCAVSVACGFKETELIDIPGNQAS